jgi:hypothetical protein
MAEDILAKFRRPGSPPPEPEPEKTGPEPYEAFKAVNRRQLRLHIRPVGSPGERMTYGYLHRIVDDEGRDEQLALVFSFAVVILRGRDLYPVADAIAEERAEWVQQWDAARWPMPPEDKPFIESIVIHVGREPMQEAQEEFPANAAKGKRR